MSDINNADRYINPTIPTKSQLIYKNYSKIKEAVSNPTFTEGVIFVDQPDINDYPTNASFARFPVMVKCNACSQLAMTEIEYKHGTASKIWCLLLSPLMCTGACCLCLNSCKDVKHVCGNCHEEVGKNKSRVC